MVALVCMASVVQAADPPTDGCCAKCIGKTANSQYDYDPLVYEQCAKPELGRVCCFGCSETEAASPQFVNADYTADGTTPQIKAGEWLQIKWANIARVTYETYKKSQAKVTTVKNASAEAKVESGVFFICAGTEGKISVRGWGSDPCTVATVEASVDVIAGAGSGTCAVRTPTAPSESSKSDSAKTTNPDVENCNLQRASIVTVDGNQTCVCATEWTGAPECTGYPWWKILVTVGGGIAALLSIAVSVKAFMNSRRAKQAEAEARTEKDDAILDEESITIAGGHNMRAAPYQYNDKHNTPEAYQYHQPPTTTAKAHDHKEYSL